MDHHSQRGGRNSAPRRSHHHPVEIGILQTQTPRPHIQGKSGERKRTQWRIHFLGNAISAFRGGPDLVASIVMCHCSDLAQQNEAFLC